MLMKPMHRAVALLSSFGLLAGACNNAPARPIDEVFEAVQEETVTSQGSNKIDVLFVIANSTSVDEERVLLEQAFPTFIRGLLEKNADFHIGVITPDMRTSTERGTLHEGPNNSPSPGFDWLTTDGNAPDWTGGGRAPDNALTCTVATQATDCVLTVASGVYNGKCDVVSGETNGFCSVARRFCDAPPAELDDICNNRFEPLMDEGEQVDCVYTETCRPGTSPKWQEVCEDINNQACEAVEGPVGTRRCNASNKCEIRPKFLRTTKYLQGGNDTVNTEDVVNDFACLSNVGTCYISASTSPERGLDAVRAALDPKNTENVGFVRPDAILLVIFISDDDDCSIGNGADAKERLSSEECWGRNAIELSRLEELQNFLTTEVKSSAAKVMTAAIVGPVPVGFTWNGPAYSCSAADDTSGTRLATAGDRYTRFVRGFGSRGVVGSICNANFDAVLRQVTRAVGRSLGQNCLAATPRICAEDNDCAGEATCVVAQPPRALVREDIEEIRSGTSVPCADVDECLVSEDPRNENRVCSAGGTCFLNDQTVACSSNSDCSSDGSRICDEGLCYQANFPPGTNPRRVCDDFSVTIQTAPANSSNFTQLKGPGKPDTLDYDEGYDYEINYYAYEACPETGVGYSFVAPPAIDDQIRIRYPVSLRDQMFQ